MITRSCLILVVLCGLASAGRLARPATVSHPLFTGIIDLRTTPGVDDPRAPATIKASGVARRAAGYPAAPQLSVTPIERLSAAAIPASGNEGFSSAPLLLDDATLDPRTTQIQTTLAGAPQIGRRLHQASAPAGSAPRVPLRHRAAGSHAGFAAPAPAGKAAGGGGGTASIAVSDDRAVHVAGGVVNIYSLTAASGERNATLAAIRLQDLFAPVGSSNCRDGVYDAHATFDPHARRFYVATACGGSGSALLAASAAAEPFGAWYVYNLNADAVGTRLACPNRESALVDYPRVSFNADALAVSLHSYCPSSGGAPGAPGAGATLLVLPKGAVVRGETRLSYPVFTSFEVAQAASGGDSGLAGSVVQLEPAAPQSEADVTQGQMHFIADLAVPKGQPRRSFLLVSLVNTGAMWGFTGASSAVPLMAAAVADRGAAVAAPAADSRLPQPEGAPALEVAGLPTGFWNGRAVWTYGQVWAVEEAAAQDGPAQAQAPSRTLAWTVLQPLLQVSDGGACTATTSWGQGFDFSNDTSADFGASVQPAWERFVLRSVNVTQLGAQALAAYGTRLAPGKEGGVVAASAADTEAAEQLSRTDVSPFFVPTKDVPRVSAAAGAAGVQAAAATVYGNRGGRGGFEGWSCWSCGRGTAGYYVSPAQYGYGFGGTGLTSGMSGFNLNGGAGSGYTNSILGGIDGMRNGGWGGGPLNNFGSGPYGAGYSSNGWGGGYFGGFFSGSNVGGVNWGSSCQIMCQRAWQGTGGVFGWGTAVAPSGWGPFGIFPFGGSGTGLGSMMNGLGSWFGHRRLLHVVEGTADNGEDESAAAAAPAAGTAVASLDRGDDEVVQASSVAVAAVAAAVHSAQGLAGRSFLPACVAPAATCKAARAAGCPAGAEPGFSLTARLVQNGALAPQAGGALSFAVPALAVRRDGAMLIAATFSGAGRIRGSAAPAYPGIASISVAPGGGAAVLRVEQRGTQALSPDAVASLGAWPAPPALAVQAVTGAVYLTAEQLPGSTAPAWVSVLPQDS